MSWNKQRGYALLATASMILLGIAITGLVVGRSMYFEQKEQNNEYQQHMAFQAAEAGLEYGIGYLYNNESAILQDSNHDGFIDAYSNASVSQVALPNGATYSIVFSNTVASNYQTLQIASTGIASAGEAQRTIRVLLRIYPLLVSAPPAGVVAKNSVDLSGNVTISNTVTGKTIWSGGTTGLSGSAATDAGNGSGSDKDNIGSDVIQNDSGLSSLSGDQFFSGFFGQNKTQVQQNADLVYNNSSNTNMSSSLDGVVGKAIWINQTSGDATVNGNITIGSATQPVILIVNGPFKANGNATVYGMVYIIGDWDNNGGGTLTVNGSVAVEGNLSSQGTPNVNYNQSVISNLGQIGDYVKVPGSWRDF